jgi:lipopolysaccharide transport system ATP-binding protein
LFFVDSGCLESRNGLCLCAFSQGPPGIPISTSIRGIETLINDLAIHTEGLSKRYRLGERQRENALRNVLGDIARAPWKLVKREQKKDFWALKDVDLEVKRGDVLGLIGRNGAGKTTLLKILSRITRPTRGWAEIYGRVGSLLEVGTGFHPELSGRDNVFLSGAILGMSKKEIRRNFDEIVAFAEIEEFLDTQVKHYSSGMYVRLAFAVAAHLEPEILLVDEVLAVGDIAFQRKCLGKMGKVARTGRTVILVSHNMAAINSLCSRVILMKHGRAVFDGPAAEATARYYADSVKVGAQGEDLANRPRLEEANGKARFTSVTIQPMSEDGMELEAAQPGCNLEVEVELESLRDFSDGNLAIIFYDVNGYRVIDTNTSQKGQFVSLKSGQKARARFNLIQVLLRPGTYFVSLWLGRAPMELIDYVEHAVELRVVESEETNKYSEIYPGVYLCRFENQFDVIES